MRESVESVLKKKRKATVRRFCRKGRFLAWNERERVGDGIEKILTEQHSYHSLQQAYRMLLEALGCIAVLDWICL